jgi:nucleoside-diphosphate-sugar epimerase
VNVEGTRHVLEAAADVGVERFVHISSIAVYGISPREGTSETDPYQPCGLFYCDTKIEAEEVAFKYYKERGLPLVVIRPANVYGPRSSFWTVELMMMIKSGQLELIEGGQGMSNHVYIDNLVDAILLAAGSDAAVGEAFIVSDGAGTDWKEFLGHYARMVGGTPLPSMSKATARQRTRPGCLLRGDVRSPMCDTTLLNGQSLRYERGAPSGVGVIDSTLACGYHLQRESRTGDG